MNKQSVSCYEITFIVIRSHSSHIFIFRNEMTSLEGRAYILLSQGLDKSSAEIISVT